MAQGIRLPPPNGINGDSRPGVAGRSHAGIGTQLPPIRPHALSEQLSNDGDHPSMGSPSYRLPPLSEILRGVDQNRPPEGHQQHGPSSAPRRQPGFNEAGTLAPSPGRLRPNFASPAPFPSESSSEYSDRRSSFASPSSSVSLASTRASPVVAPIPQMQPPHHPSSEYAARGLPPLFGGGEQPPRSAGSPSQPPPYPSPYGHPPQGYPGPYGHAPPGPPNGYGVPYEGQGGMGDYGDGKKRRRGNLPKHVTDILRHWFHDHIAHPYPTEEEKQVLMNSTGLTMSQISNWFINARRRSLPGIHNRQAQEARDRD